MDGRKPLAIAAALALAVAMSLGVMWWRGHEGAEAPPPAREPAHTAKSSAALPAPAPPAAPNASPVGLMQAPGAAHSPAMAPALPPELPASISFRQRKEDNQREAIIANTVGSELNITVLVTSPSTYFTTSKQITVTASGQAVIGPDDGFQLQSGDEVTLQCAGYRDRTATIP